jgi:CelD/BcsL family acetyltransferase involved in cellulose biosynthesis
MFDTDQVARTAPRPSPTRTLDLPSWPAGRDLQPPGATKNVTPLEAAALRVSLITTAADLAALAPEWDRLAASLVPWTPFATPTWNLTHWRHFQRRSLSTRDRLHAYAIRNAQGDLVGVAPMHLTLRPGFGPFCLRSLVFFGADPNVTEIRGLMCRPADENAVFAALMDAVAGEKRAWDWLHWGTLNRHSAAFAHGMQHLAPASERIIPAFYIELPASFEALKTRLSRNTKEALRKCYNSLKRAGHEFEFEVISKPGMVAPALDRFFELHAARADADYNIAHPNAFALPVAQAFLRDYARQAAERGELRIFQLRIAGEVVASRIGFCSGDDLYLYYSGHLPAFGRFSVMTTTVAEALKWAIQGGLKRVHLSIGRDRSKLRWEPRELTLSETYQAAPTWRGRLMQRMFAERSLATGLWGQPGRPDVQMANEQGD